MTTVYLVRHGETNNNQEHRCNGCRSDQPLSPRGVAQASALCPYFKKHPVDVVYASPLTRAKQTAMLAFDAEERALCIEPELREVDLGIWDGMLHEEARELYPEEVKYSWWSYRFQARAKDIGWRIDYFVTSKRLMDKVSDSKIHTDVFGSDHCPVSLEIEI